MDSSKTDSRKKQHKTLQEMDGEQNPPTPVTKQQQPQKERRDRRGYDSNIQQKYGKRGIDSSLIIPNDSPPRPQSKKQHKFGSKHAKSHQRGNQQVNYSPSAAGLDTHMAIVPGAQAVSGPFGMSTEESVGTIIVGDDPTATTRASTAAMTNLSSGTTGEGDGLVLENDGLVLMQAELVEDTTVDAVPVDEEGLTQDYQDLKRGYKTLRKRVIIASLLLVAVIGVIVAVVFGTRSNESDSIIEAGSRNGTALAPPVPCLVATDIDCTVSDDPGRSCSSIPNPQRSCESPPLAIFFNYNGENCLTSQFLNHQGSSLLDCVDFNGGPSVLNGQSAHVIATDTDTNKIYTKESILVGGSFSILGDLAYGLPLGASTNITIYSDADRQILLQTMLIQSDCSRSFSLNDRLGSIAVGSFIAGGDFVNGDNDIVNITYTYSITNDGSENVTLTSFSGYLDGGNFTADDLAIIAPGTSSKVASRTVTIDLATRQRYETGGTIFATTLSSDKIDTCSDRGSVDFLAGIPAPTFFPTSSPTSTTAPSLRPSALPSESGAPSQSPVAPTVAPIANTATPSFPNGSNNFPPTLLLPPASSPVFPPLIPPPTPEPSFSSAQLCVLNLEIDCILPASGLNCASPPPPQNTVCASRPFVMTFRFNAENCQQSSNNQDAAQFQCEDFSQDTPPLNNYAVVSDQITGAVYHKGLVGFRDTFTVQNGGRQLASVLNITFYSSEDTSNPDNLVQTLAFESSCASSAAPLMLTDQFGSVQLISYISQEEGVVNNLVTATYVYTLTAPVTENIELDTLTSVATPQPGDSDLSDQLPAVLEMGKTLTVEHDFAFDLSETSLVYENDAVISGPRCFGRGALIFSV